MIRTLMAATALLMATMAANAGQIEIFPQITELKRPGDSGFHMITADYMAPDVLPVGSVVRAIRRPWNLLTIQQDVVTPVVQVPLDAGTWLINGACTVQDTVSPIFLFDSYNFIWTYSAFSRAPHRYTDDGMFSTDAKWYGTEWFGTNPPPNVFVLGTDPTIYLTVKSHTSAEAPHSDVYGAIVAVKISL